MADDRFTVADLARLTGAPHRSIRLWTDEMVLLADPGSRNSGPGVHRLYGRENLYVAALANVLAGHGMKVAHIRVVASLMRDHIMFSRSDQSAVFPELWNHAEGFRQALRGEGPVYLAYCLPPLGVSDPEASGSIAWITEPAGDPSFTPGSLFGAVGKAVGTMFGLIEVSSIFSRLA